MPSQGYIYILTNSADTSAVKVGRTNDLQRRLSEHNSSSNVIGVWDLHWSIEVPDMKRAEGLALKSLSRWKVPGRREQFRCGPKNAEKEVSVALAEWSIWGREEQARREKRQSREQEAQKRAHKAKERARAAQKCKEEDERLKKEDERLFEMVCSTFRNRKVEYEQAKRIVAGKERIPYPWKLNDLYLSALLALGIYYYVTGTGPEIWARFIVTVACLYGLFALTEAWDRFREWQKTKDINSFLGTIKNYETVYPDGVPPRSVNDLWHRKR